MKEKKYRDMLTIPIEDGSNRTTDCDVKVYYQMRSVAYADYKIGYFYISPSDLYKVDGESCMVLPGDITETAKEFFDFETK